MVDEVHIQPCGVTSEWCAARGGPARCGRQVTVDYDDLCRLLDHAWDRGFRAHAHDTTAPGDRGEGWVRARQWSSRHAVHRELGVPLESGPWKNDTQEGA